MALWFSPNHTASLQQILFTLFLISLEIRTQCFHVVEKLDFLALLLRHCAGGSIKKTHLIYHSQNAFYLN